MGLHDGRSRTTPILCPERQGRTHGGARPSVCTAWRSICDPEHLTTSGQALELMRPSIFEPDAGTLEQVARGGRDVHLVRPCEGHHAGGGMDRHAANVAADELDLPGVDSDSDRE